MNDRVKIANDLIKDSSVFYSKAKTYRQYEELEGCLINLMLSANNLYQALNILKIDPSNNDIDKTELTLNNTKGYYKAEQCSLNNKQCTKDLEGILNTILNEIKPLQLRLRDVKSTGNENSASGNKDEQATDCKDIQEEVMKGDPLYADIVGCEEAKSKLTDTFIKPFEYPNLYKDKTKAILLYGPPGTGKTMLAKAAINELKLKQKDVQIHFFAPLAADLKGKYVGDTEKKIKGYFECASQKACEQEIEEGKPFQRHLSILFLDEVEAIATSRGDETVGASMTSSVNTLLQMMDGVQSKPNVIVIAATNYPWKLDGAFLRRFQSRILIDLPRQEDISKLILLQFSKFLEVDFDETIGAWKGDKFVKQSGPEGVLLLKYKRDVNNQSVLVDDIFAHCTIMKDKMDRPRYSDVPKLEENPYKSKKTPKKLLAGTQLPKELDANTFLTLFSENNIRYLNFGMDNTLDEVLKGVKGDEKLYLNTKKRVVIEDVLKKANVNARTMKLDLFSNSDINNCMNAYFAILAKESMEVSKRFAIEFLDNEFTSESGRDEKNDRTFLVDAKSVHEGPLTGAMKTIQDEEYKVGPILIGEKEYTPLVNFEKSYLIDFTDEHISQAWVETKNGRTELFKKHDEVYTSNHVNCVNPDATASVDFITQLRTNNEEEIYIMSTILWNCKRHRNLFEKYTKIKKVQSKASDIVENFDKAEESPGLSGLPEDNPSSPKSLLTTADYKKVNDIRMKYPPGWLSRINLKFWTWEISIPNLGISDWWFGMRSSKIPGEIKNLQKKYDKEMRDYNEEQKKLYDEALIEDTKENTNFSVLLHSVHTIVFKQDEQYVSYDLKKLVDTFIAAFKKRDVDNLWYLDNQPSTFLLPKYTQIAYQENKRGVPFLQKYDVERFFHDMLKYVIREKPNSYDDFKRKLNERIRQVKEQNQYKVGRYGAVDYVHDGSTNTCFIWDENLVKKESFDITKTNGKNFIYDVHLTPVGTDFFPIESYTDTGHQLSKELYGEPENQYESYSTFVLGVYLKSLDDLFWTLFESSVKVALKGDINIRGRQFTLKALPKVKSKQEGSSKKLYRTFNMDLLDFQKRMLQGGDKYHPATIKADYAEMIYYEHKRIAPNTKETKKAAYKYVASLGDEYKWAKDLKVAD